MPDDSELAGLDPYDAMGDERTRISNLYAELPEDRWSEPSGCEAWSKRQLLAHLRACEDYFGACLDGTVANFMAAMGEKGVTSLDEFNAQGVAEYSGVADDTLLSDWRLISEATVNGFRQRDGGNVDTTVGDYPARWQAWHLAQELATHAEDAGVPRTFNEWRTPFSRFALAEVHEDYEITVTGDRTRVVGGGIDVTLTDEELIDAVAGRTKPDSRLTPEEKAALSATP